VHAVNPQAAEWSTHIELTAALCELFDYGNRLFMMANKAKGGRVPDPIKIERPQQEPLGPRKQATKQEIAAFFAGKVRSSAKEN
jgi:hypothetical protein